MARIDLDEQRDESLDDKGIALGPEKDLAVLITGIEPYVALTTLDKVVVGLGLGRQRFLLAAKVYEQLIAVEPIVEIIELGNYSVLYFLYR
jgi:hypothetical protein